MDHGEGVGHQHAVLLYDDPSGSCYVVDEYTNDSATTPAADVARILAMLARHGLTPLHVDRWYGDVNSAGKLAEGASVNAEMERAFAAALGVRECPWRVEKPSKGAGSVAYGERLLNYALHRGDLALCERARRTVRAFWSYRGGDSDPGKHAVDAVRYGLRDVLEARPGYGRLYVRH
jgi:hypothetical protein